MGLRPKEPGLACCKTFEPLAGLASRVAAEQHTQCSHVISGLTLEFPWWLSGLRTQHSICKDVGSIPGLTQWVKDPVLLWPAAAAPIQPLARESPYAAGEALRNRNGLALPLISPGGAGPFQPFSHLVRCTLYPQGGPHCHRSPPTGKRCNISRFLSTSHVLDSPPFGIHSNSFPLLPSTCNTYCFYIFQTGRS